MIEELKRSILTVITCFAFVLVVPTCDVVASEKPKSNNPTAQEVLEYVFDSGDKEYLIEHKDLFPNIMVTELVKTNSEEWDKMVELQELMISNQPMEYHLTMSAGAIQGPSGKETYYNLDMSGVVSIMRSEGYSEKEYPYWIRDDGVKMLGPYVMVAAAFNIRPRGTILESSLGTAIVCDTGGFASYNQEQLDIAVAW